MKTIIVSIITLIGQFLISQTLTINVENISKSGTLMVAVFDSQENFDLKKPAYAKIEEVTDQTSQTVTFEVEKGTYIITLFVDENNNQTFDYGAEMYALSNNYFPRAYPMFDDFKFEVTENTTQNLKLTY